MTHTEENPAATTAKPASHFQDTPHSGIPFRYGRRFAIFSGLLLWLSHPSPGLWPLAWVGLTPLIVCIWEATGPRQAAVRGYLFGWAYLAPTWYWTGLTIVGWTGSPIGWAALLLLTLLAAIFYALWATAAWWIARRTTGAWRIIGTATAWVLMEWLRSVGTLSVPWAQVCYTQYRVIPIIQIAEVTGALGVSFLILLFNGSIAESWQRRHEPRSRRWVAGSIGILGLTGLAGGLRIQHLGDGKPFDVALMQGNFDYEHGVNLLRSKVATYESLTRAAYTHSNPKPALYVWAETAAPGDAYNDPTSRGILQGLADQYSSGILTGSRILDGAIETNSALLFTPDSVKPERFDKQGIVPFGEYIPFRAQIPARIQEQFQFFDTDLTPGKSLIPMAFDTPQYGRINVGPFICYESVYPHYARTMTARGANLLVTPSHDSWFHSDAAMEQHLAIVVFRAIENRRDVARATTDGVTAAIDASGRILARAPMHTTCFLLQRLHLRDMRTIYTRFGDWFVGLSVVLFVAAGARAGFPGREATDGPT